MRILRFFFVHGVCVMLWPQAEACCGLFEANAECFLPIFHGNATLAMQAAIGCGVSTVRVPALANQVVWVISTALILNVSNQRMLLEPGVTVEAQRDAFHASDSHMFTIDNVTNVSLSGYDAMVVMRKEDYANASLYSHSEWRHAISITSSKNIVVEGLNIMSSGGDGIYIGGNQRYITTCKISGQLCDSENVYIKDVNLTDHFRNAMSVTGCVNLTVKRSIFAKTGGTCCMSGVDLGEIQNRFLILILV